MKLVRYKKDAKLQKGWVDTKRMGIYVKDGKYEKDSKIQEG